MLPTVALDTIPRIGPDTSGHIPLDACSGRVGARCWMGSLLGCALARAQGRSRRRERERAMDELVVVDSHGWRVVVSEEDAE
ncbi:hypothetical protein C487_17225 [Natrinema pallidum DSM 3751]|uniref:Uncharacterized protein n=1 Tax=Natrinema pallidum DSM 3751 TaxID=1227495 RepID=L9YHD5_9EURY|nr:hypothetical protein C487_17225 [Natrinema pallidum DSM 3751]